MNYPLVIGELLKTGLRANPAQRICDAGGVDLTYAQFGARVHRLGAALASLGLGEGGWWP